MTTHTTTDATSKDDKDSAESTPISIPQAHTVAYTNGAEAEQDTLTMINSAPHDSRSIEDESEISSAEKVFRIAELAEKILLEMEPLDIISASNICRSISATVWGSPDIRRLLFSNRALAKVFGFHWTSSRPGSSRKA
jgi:hypothetical protein